MNDLMTKSFVSYVDLKKSALRDIEADAAADAEFAAGIEMMRTSADENLRRFFLDAESAREDMDSIRSLLASLQEASEESKSLHEPEALRSLRARINSDIVLVLKKANSIKSRLEAMDRANAANRRLSGYREGTHRPDEDLGDQRAPQEAQGADDGVPDAAAADDGGVQGDGGEEVLHGDGDGARGGGDREDHIGGGDGRTCSRRRRRSTGRGGCWTRCTRSRTGTTRPRRSRRACWSCTSVPGHGGDGGGAGGADGRHRAPRDARGALRQGREQGADDRQGVPEEQPQVVLHRDPSPAGAHLGHCHSDRYQFHQVIDVCVCFLCGFSEGSGVLLKLLCREFFDVDYYVTLVLFL
ncbi:putative syntaxin-related protein KNOLLE-like [Iris pallida]|uniref:Syntaxin-related protein KNOLLE-like n=1 Tax=Iris pallida TaxID=29817 RepID=A0AAX6HJX1_IRIPA|nr:putative syntaxin-related protein KNOLLE-like [Iris pallida]